MWREQMLSEWPRTAFYTMGLSPGSVSTRNTNACLYAQRWQVCGHRGGGHGTAAFLRIVLPTIQHVLRGHGALG
jgi:hypothetical protein